MMKIENSSVHGRFLLLFKHKRFLLTRAQKKIKIVAKKNILFTFLPHFYFLDLENVPFEACKQFLLQLGLFMAFFVLLSWHSSSPIKKFPEETN